MTFGRSGSGLGALATFEARVILRGRGTLVGMAAYGLASLVVTLLGLTSFAQLGLGAVGPAAVALLNLALLLPTVQAMTVGAMTLAGDREGSFLTMLRASGSSARSLVTAGWLGVALSAGLSTLVGFGVAAVLLATTVPLADLLAFAELLVVSLLVAAAAAAIGILIGVLADNRLQAGLAAVAVWFVVAIGLDLLLLGLGAFARVGELALIGAVLVNPLETGRVLALLALDPQGGALGPAGSYVLTQLGLLPAAGVLTATLLAWIGVPLALAARVLGRRDL